MEVIGTVVSVEVDVQVAKNGGGSYPGSRLAYRDENGAMKEKAFHNNTFKFNPALKTSLSNLSQGDRFSMEMVKENDFWNVKSINKVEGNSVKPNVQTQETKAYTSPKSTYETPEERAKKQVYIVRQSSISAALEYSKSVKALKSVDDVLTIAKQFEAFVFGTDYDDGSVYTMKDDIPE